MMRRAWAVSAAGALIFAPIGAAGQEIANPNEAVATVAADGENAMDAGNNKDFGEIVVVANREGNYVVGAGDIREMVEAFHKWGPKHAPDSALFLQFKPAKGQELAAIEANLQRGKDNIALPIGADGLARLPVEQMGDGKWDLTMNQVKGKLKIFPLVFSPGTSATDRRMGDLRLQCRVFWGFYNNQVNIFLRGLVDMVGGCTSKNLGIYYPADQPLESALFEGKDQAQRLSPNKSSYLVELWNTSISDDTRLRLTYAAPVESDAADLQP